MKVLFAGPSVHGCRFEHPTVSVRPPASHGDLQAAVLQGATVIGLVDGLFESIAAVWHKEILFALSEGVTVLGAASLGALRAAECQTFGMIAVGEVARRYARGELDDDAAVAQIHGPAELGFVPLTEALVDCEAAVTALGRSGVLLESEAAALLASARALFFKERTWQAVLGLAGIPESRAPQLLSMLKRRQTSLKRRDALQLVEVMEALPDARGNAPPGWRLAQTPAWRRSLAASGGRKGLVLSTLAC